MAEKPYPNISSLPSKIYLPSFLAKKLNKPKVLSVHELWSFLGTLNLSLFVLNIVLLCATTNYTRFWAST
jgi:hypothetical protein